MILICYFYDCTRIICPVIIGVQFYCMLTFLPSVPAAACVNFTESSIRVREDDEYATICVELTGQLQDDLSVYLFTIPGTALGKYYIACKSTLLHQFTAFYPLATRDFIPLRETLVFVDGGVMCVNVTLVTGSRVESLEKFTVVLTSHDERLEVKEYYIPVYITDADSE